MFKIVNFRVYHLMFDRYGAIITKCGTINLEMKAPFFFYLFIKNRRESTSLFQNTETPPQSAFTLLLKDI